MSGKTQVGVIGVGSMGRHHARVYSELPEADLLGVADVDGARARDVAREFDTRALPRERLLRSVEAVSIAVPTRHHASVAHEAVDAGAHLLIEKPLVVDPAAGRELLRAADEAGLVVQVGHVERYNPAITTLRNVLADVDPLAVAARRQGPPVDRDDTASVVFDLMIHDIDVTLSLVESSVTGLAAFRVPERSHVVAQLEFADGTIATLTASRISQARIRDLSVTAEDCRITVDYMDQSVDIHRRSLPEYVTTDGDVRFRHENVIERPTVENGEPLKRELLAFVETVVEGEDPTPTGRDGLRAVEVATQVEAALDPAREAVSEVREV